MKPHFTPDYLKEVRDRLGSGLVGIVAESVRLKKSGSLHQGCCPFHDEKTPSFYVRDGNSGWHYVCHGCGATGDVFSWLTKQGGLQFHDAVAYVAERVGMELPAVSPEQKQKHDRLERLRQIVDHTARWFGNKLYQECGAEALAYLKDERGIGDDQIRDFQLGYAPGDFQAWRDLIADLMTQRQFSGKELCDSGVFRLDDEDRQAAPVLHQQADLRDPGSPGTAHRLCRTAHGRG